MVNKLLDFNNPKALLKGTILPESHQNHYKIDYLLVLNLLGISNYQH